MNGEGLEEAVKFKYVGVMITANLEMKEELTKRLQELKKI